MLRILALSLVVFGAAFAGAQPPAASSPSPTTNPAPAAAPAKGTPSSTPAPATASNPASEARITFSQCHVEGPFAAITFDDGPHGGQTPRLLKMLKDRGIHSTFFVVGQCVAENPEIARQIVAEGHEIANHSWDHPLLSKMGQESVREQLQRTHEVVRQETGVNMSLFRPPFGGFTPNQRSWAHATWGYRVILWDVDSLDWKHRSPAKTQAIVLSSARPGSIILCHDIHKTTVDAMPATLDGLLAKGLKLVTVSDLLKMHRQGAATAPRAAAAPARTLPPNEAAAAATSLSDLEKVTPIKAEPAR
jgi:peptidoglycan-N-acetylglucosamine deacetylase